MRKLIALSLASLLTQAQAAELLPFTATYSADWKTLPVSGSASRTLKRLDGERWSLEFNASMLVTSMDESSTFKMDKDGFMPLNYKIKRGGLGKAKQSEYDFDWVEKQIMGTDNGDAVRLPLNRGVLDKSTYQIALQQDVASGKTSMSYQVVDGDELDTYDFRVLGTEIVTTPLGKFNAVKVERVRDPSKSNRKTLLWFAKDNQYLLVQLYQKEKDGKEYQIMLKEATLQNRPVTGKP